jgi:hypothetical protein
MIIIIIITITIIVFFFIFYTAHMLFESTNMKLSPIGQAAVKDPTIQLLPGHAHLRSEVVCVAQNESPVVVMVRQFE